ncbi:Fe-S cluster assembly protein HesB [Nocardioides sp. KR10-350]|uniref:Fe-S cluster assembly protein HesB n=1 Tax=Nocardioides cheoyonin TaxID=3156615 RepID=UPI0032B35F91
MLTLTENATTIINNLVNQPGTPEGSGLRITSDSPEPGLAVTTATAAQPGDQVVEQQGATVYLDETAATLLDDKVLDASLTQEGKVEFAIGQQG